MIAIGQGWLASRRAATALAAGLALAALPAAAQVYQLEPDGVVLVRRGSGPVEWHDTAPSAPAPVRLAPARLIPGQQVPVRLTPTRVAPVPAPTSAGQVLDGTALLHQAAAQAGLHPALLEALVWQESRWRPDAVSAKGAIGLTQLMPGTARDLGVDPRDPVANLYGGARHLRSLLDRFDGDLVKALAAYNAGARRVDAAGGVPPIRETQNYVASILGRLGRTLPSR